MNYVKLIAPAKINLVLAVGEKLPDGYHEAHTILQALALHDTLEIRSFPAEPGAGLSITLKCESSNMIDQLTIDQEDNIVYKAATELARALDRAVDEEIHIYLAKQIPFEAGLGGGSSDAAATLKGLPALWGVDPLDPAVIEVAAKLGADVPFFLYGGCAYFDGKGDHFVHALEPRKGFLALIRPEGSGVSSKEAYERFDEAPEYPAPGFIQVTPWNNLTSASLCLKPELQEVFDLIEGSAKANAQVLCGSGSAVAALCNSYEDACALSTEARKHGFYSRVTSFASVGAEVLKQY